MMIIPLYPGAVSLDLTKDRTECWKTMGKAVLLNLLSRSNLFTTSRSQRRQADGARLFNNVRYSDIIIRLDETEVDLPAHRIVIGLQSPPLDEFIAKHPRGTLPVLVWQNASEHSIWRTFRYLYEGDYSEDTATALEGFGKLCNLQQFCDHGID